MWLNLGSDAHPESTISMEAKSEPKTTVDVGFCLGQTIFAIHPGASSTALKCHQHGSPNTHGFSDLLQTGETNKNKIQPITNQKLSSNKSNSLCIKMHEKTNKLNLLEKRRRTQGWRDNPIKTRKFAFPAKMQV